MNIYLVAEEVKQWSLDNFGDQKGINHLAPLLGLGEEVGELADAIESDSGQELVNDAVGDIGIYSCDLCGRLDIPIEEVWPTAINKKVKGSYTNYLGNVMHCCLKNHQGIRGFEDSIYFRTKFVEALSLFLQKVNNNFDLTDNTIDTWTKIVSKRNWKKDA